MQSWKDTNVTAITMITSLKNFVGKIETIVEPKPINDQTTGDAKPSFTPIGKRDLTILTLSRVKGKEKAPKGKPGRGIDFQQLPKFELRRMCPSAQKPTS